MPADSIRRRILKRVFFPLLNERAYRFAQCLAKAWDIHNGNWSEPELELIPFAVEKGESVIDIGANYGLYCYHLSRAVGKSGKVYAFEPVPFTYKTCKLVSRVLRFENVEIVQKGCSERTEKVAFTVPIQESGPISAGLSHLSGRNDQRRGKELFSQYDNTREILCDVVALDDYLPDLTNISFVKCDIEGADIFALRGAAKLIENNFPTVLCEINPWFLEGFGVNPLDFDDLFHKNGYIMYHYDITDGKKFLQSVTVNELGTLKTHNYVFIHPSRIQRFSSLLEAVHGNGSPMS